MRRRRTAMFVALSSLVIACGSDSTGPSNFGNSGSAFDITVSGGRNPTYTWSGGTAQSVSVVRVSAPATIVWGLANTSLAIPSPVTHGTVPGGSLATSTTEATLTTGVAYRVSIARNDQKVGFKEFTP